MSSLEQLELEEFGFQLRPAIQLFDPAEVQGLDAHHYNLLAISNKHNLLFAYLNNKLKIIDSQELDKLLSTDPDSDSYSIACLQEFEQAGIVQIVLSADESHLIIVKQDTIEQANLDNLKQGTWATEILTSVDCEVVYLASSALGTIAYLLADGRLMLFDGTGTKILRQECNCFDWIDNKTLLIGVDSHVELLKTDSGSSETISLVEDRKPVFVTALERDSWLVVLGGETDDDDTKSYVITRNGDTFDKSEAYDICMPFGVIPRKLSFYTLHLHKWSSSYPHLVFLTSSKSTEFNTLTKTQQLLQLNDSDRAQMPLDPDSGDDDTPLGLVLDLTGKSEVLEPCQQVEKCGALPKMIALTNRGQLLVWNIWLSTDINAGKVDLGAAKEAASTETGKIEVLESSESQQAAPEQTLPKDLASSFSQNKTSLFGQSEKPAVQSPFGSSTATSSPFGKSGFSTATGGSAFGKSGFGQSAFGSAASGSSNSSGFGQSGFGSSGFSFGRSNPTANASSQKSTDAPKSFGAFSSFSSGTNAFASKSSSPFNIQPKEDIFASADKKGSSPFGETKSSFGNTSSSLFGQGGSAFKFGSNNQVSKDSPFAQLSSKPVSQEEKKDSQLSSGSSPFGLNFKSSLGLDNLKLGSKSQSPSPFANLSGNTESPFSSLNKKSESPFASLGNKESTPFSNLNSPAFNFSQSKQEADKEAEEVIEDSENQSDETLDGDDSDEDEKDDVLEENEGEAEVKTPEEVPSLEDSDLSEHSAELDGSFEEIERPESLDASAQKTQELHVAAKAEEDSEKDSEEQPVPPSAERKVSQSGTEENDAGQPQEVAKPSELKPSDDAAETEQDSTVESPQSDSNADQSVSESSSGSAAVPSAAAQSELEAGKTDLIPPPKSPLVEKSVSTTESKVVEKNVDFGEIDEDKGPKAVPQLVSLGSVAVPELSSNEVLREMEKIVYHTDAEFNILHENIRLFEEFMEDHASGKYPRNFKDHSLFPTSWRLSEVGKLSEVMNQNVADYSKLKADLGATFDDTSSLLSKLNAITNQSDEIHTMLRELEQNRKHPHLEKNLSPAASQKLDAIRKGYEKLRDMENDLHARLFVLNGRLFPERILDSPTNFEVIVSGLDAKLRTYYDQLKYLQEKISEYKAKDKPVTKLLQQFDKLSVASLVSQTAAKEQLGTYLQGRKSVTHTVEL